MEEIIDVEEVVEPDKVVDPKVVYVVNKLKDGIQKMEVDHIDRHGHMYPVGYRSAWEYAPAGKWFHTLAEAKYKLQQLISRQRESCKTRLKGIRRLERQILNMEVDEPYEIVFSQRQMEQLEFHSRRLAIPVPELIKAWVVNVLEDEEHNWQAL